MIYISIIILLIAIGVLILTYIILIRTHQKENVLDYETIDNITAQDDEENIDQESDEEEMEFESEFPTRSENAHTIAVLYAMFEESNPMTKRAEKRKANAIYKCLKIAKRYIDEIHDETFDETPNYSNENEE